MNTVMSATEMRKELIEMREKSLDKKSKWYNTDLQDYISFVKSRDKQELLRIYKNTCALNSDSFEKTVQREINLLDKAGMFVAKNMTPKHMLD